MNCCTDISFKMLYVWIHCSFSDCKLFRPKGSKTAVSHDTLSTVLHSRDQVLVFVCFFLWTSFVSTVHRIVSQKCCGTSRHGQTWEMSRNVWQQWFPTVCVEFSRFVYGVSYCTLMSTQIFSSAYVGFANFYTICLSSLQDNDSILLRLQYTFHLL